MIRHLYFAMVKGERWEPCNRKQKFSWQSSEEFTNTFHSLFHKTVKSNTKFNGQGHRFPVNDANI